MKKKRVVYLLGAGASHAAVRLVDDGIGLLMKDITMAIFPKIREQKDKDLDPIANELLLPSVDVERLITLFENSGVYNHARLASVLRRLFYEELQGRLTRLPHSLEPDLLGALFDQHNIPDNDEALEAVLTLNYDSLAEDALVRSHGGFDYTIKGVPLGTREGSRKGGMPVLKLHGSFDWRKDYPMKLMERGSKASDEELLWIPPGVEKRRERYPFSILWGHAQEILDCEVLRVVGCSLSANDWHLVTLLFGTQRASSSASSYTIELIDFPNCCEEIKNRYAYLQIVGLMEQEDFIRSVAEDMFPTLAPDATINDAQKVEIAEYLSGGKVNVLDRWLRARGESLRLSGAKLATKSGIFERYLDGGTS